ncbi:uncharacterized protein LOC117135544 [Drosophila mauritiana]|uniref:Uncharacterized protein LOC117135544 n=1 Tax=Drosophila mauritiana TaxID=7226 RepID=A0A6P8JFG3_DROMA|nr:uncharacterized protein LOC117135544 [Drosophila mauritiana]
MTKSPHWYTVSNIVIPSQSGKHLQSDIGLLKLSESIDYNENNVFQNLCPASPEFSKDNKNDIALLRINQPVAMGQLKPICMLLKERHQEMAKSSAPISFDYVQTADRIQVLSNNATLTDPRICANRLLRTIESNQVCVQVPPETVHENATRGGILGLRVMYLGKEVLILFGISSYSHNDIDVFTNVMAHTQWIANVVNSDHQL